jgi:hypothetical protein
MRIVFSGFLILLLSLAIMSCKTASAVQEEERQQEELEQSFERVYSDYKASLDLGGAETYTVVEGDRLSAITRNKYGADKGYYFPLIMLASSDVVQDPDLIEPGMKLTIPVLQKNIDNPASRQRVKAFLLDIADVYEHKEETETRENKRQEAERTKERLRQLADTL